MLKICLFCFPGFLTIILRYSSNYICGDQVIIINIFQTKEVNNKNYFFSRSWTLLAISISSYFTLPVPSIYHKAQKVWQWKFLISSDSSKFSLETFKSISPIEPTANLSEFSLSKFHACPIVQSFFIKLFHYVEYFMLADREQQNSAVKLAVFQKTKLFLTRISFFVYYYAKP